MSNNGVLAPAALLKWVLRRSRETVITRADRAREAGQWDMAARLYGKALDRNPRNPPILVQYGHALKESGHLAGAEAAYRRALSYDPFVADFHLQLGHILKLQGNIDEARDAYLRALIFDGRSTEPMRELDDLGYSGNALSIPSLRTLMRPAEAVAASADRAADAETILIAASKLFDAEYYRKQNPNIDLSNTEPLTHYLSLGYQKGLSFHPLFNVAHYTKSLRALATSKIPLIDFVTTPIGERVNPIPFFDPEHYRNIHEDIRKLNLCPYEHFLLHGRHEAHREVNRFISIYNEPSSAHPVQ